MDDYATKIKISAENLIRFDFPEKALELDKLVSSPMLSFNEVPKVRSEIRLPTAEEFIQYAQNLIHHEENSNSNSNVSTANPMKKRKTDSSDGIHSSTSENNSEIGTSVFVFNGIVPSNSLITILEEKIKPYIFHFLDSIAIIKLWIQLMIPKVEDGNNFGVSIQEDSLAEVRTLETDVTQYLDLTYKYLVSRGELIKKVAKYPHVDDYRRSVQSLDEKQFVSMRFITLELRNHYTSVHDLLMKNLEKIKKPRSTQTHSMY